jgi:small nuclear ribonucleoprotein (snRNP)-like protein
MLRASLLFRSSATIAAVAGFAAVGFAQDTTITSLDGAIQITGQVVDFDDKKIRVMSAVGELTFDRVKVICEGPGCPPDPNAAETAPDIAKTVTLSTKEGSAKVVGELVGFDGAEYVLLTANGEIRVQAETVTCTGTACPAPEPEVASPDVAEAEAASPSDPANPALVTLTTEVGDLEITGELLEFTGTEYVLLTPTGEFRIQANAAICSGAACPNSDAPASDAPASETAAIVTAEAPPPAPAELPTVTLTTNVGGIEITGDLLEFNGTEYVVLTPTGEYRLKADTVAGPGISGVAYGRCRSPTAAGP